MPRLTFCISDCGEPAGTIAKPARKAPRRACAKRFLVLALIFLTFMPRSVRGVILDYGIDPGNLGKGDWIYFIQDATNHLGGNVSSVHDLPTFMAYEKSQGMNYLIVKAGDGGNDFDGNYSFPQFNSNLVSQAHAANLQIFGYTRSYGTNVPAEIAMAAKIYNLGADGFVLDAEAEWESGAMGTNGPSRAIQLGSGIKAQFPTNFLGLSCLPIISFHSTFPYAQFGYYCDTTMPQDYWQDGGLGALVNYSPSNMVTRMDTEWRTWQQGLTGQWTNAIKPLAPTGQGWNPTSTNITTGAQITQFFNALKGDPNPVTTGGYKAVNFWRADLHTADMWTGIGGNSIGISNVAPTFTTQPQSQSVMLGSNATFTVAATGYPGPTYQWQFNSTNILSATGTSYTVTNAQMTNQGAYSVVASNISGSMASSNASLTVLSAPIITNQPRNVTFAQGSGGILVVGATGTAPLTYQWIFGGVNITSATNRGLALSNIQTNQAGSYWVVVSNNYGSVTSTVATVTVLSYPSISLQPQSQTVPVGSNATFTVSATGGNLSYTWLYNSSPIGGATSTSYTVSNAQTNDSGNYSVLVTNTLGSITSSNALLTVIATPLQFQSITVLPNGAVQLALTGVTGSSCDLNFSSDLTHWTLLTNLVNSNGAIQFTDSTSTNSASRFYRAHCGQ